MTSSDPIERGRRGARGHAGSHVFFVDDNLFVDRGERDGAVRGAGPGSGSAGACQTSIDVARDRRASCDLMARSGCTHGARRLRVPGHREPANRCARSWNLKSRLRYESSIQSPSRRGVMIYGTFVFGYDRDTLGVVRARCGLRPPDQLLPRQFQPADPDAARTALLRSAAPRRAPALRSVVARPRLPIRAGDVPPTRHDGRRTARRVYARARQRLRLPTARSPAGWCPANQRPDAHRAGIFLLGQPGSRAARSSQQGSPLGGRRTVAR